MKTTRPYKDKPWLMLKSYNWFESMMGCQDRFELDTSHPEWVEKVLKPTITRLEKWKIKR